MFAQPLCALLKGLMHAPPPLMVAVSVAAKEAHTNSVSYAQEQMATLYAEIGLPIPPTQ